MKRVLGWSLACVLAGTATPSAAQRPNETVLRTESELKFSLELPAVETTQCAATMQIEYTQRDTVARVEGTLANTHCAASSGEYRLAIRVRDEAGEIKTLEFVEAWQRDDDQPVRIAKDYPIGDDVDLQSVRSRGLQCTCAQVPPGAAAAPEGAAAPQ